MKRKLNNDALLAYARFGVEAGVPNPATALKSLRAAGFSCSKDRMDWAWQRAVTIATFMVTLMVDLPGRHPWAKAPPERLVVSDSAVMPETLRVVVTRNTHTDRSADYYGEPEVN